MSSMALLQRLAISALSFRPVKDVTSGLAAGAPVRRPQARPSSAKLVSIISLPVDDSLPAHEAFLSRSGSCAGLFEFAVRQGVRAEATGCVAKWLLDLAAHFFFVRRQQRLFCSAPAAYPPTVMADLCEIAIFLRPCAIRKRRGRGSSCGSGRRRTAPSPKEAPVG